MPDAPQTARTRRTRTILAIVAGVGLVLLALLWASRKVIAREALTGWLHARGIASETEVKAFGLTGFTGRLRIGDPARPDFTAEQAEVRYGLRNFTIEVQSVTLTRPVLRARLHDGKLTLGALDPLIEAFRKTPPRPDATKPQVEIKDGVLLLATDYGPVAARANGLVRDGKLVFLKAVADPAALKGEGFEAELGRATLTVTVRGDRVDATLGAPVTSARVGDVATEGGALQVTANLPYPDLQKRRNDGRVVARADLAGRSMTAAGQTLVDARLTAAFTGQAAGWIDDLAVTGQATADLKAASAEMGPATSGLVRGAAAASSVRWTRKGGDALSAQLKLAALVDDVEAEDLALSHASVSFRGPLMVGDDGASLSLEGGASGRGGWRGMGAVTKDDSAEIAALKRGAASFAFSAPGLALGVDNGPMKLAVRAPVLLRPDIGGTVTFAPSGDGYRLAIAGGGLPSVDADVTRFALIPGGATAGGRIRAALSIGPIEQGKFDAAGTVRIGTGVSFTASQCVSVTAAKLELGENDVEGLSGKLCPDGRPMLTLSDGGWRLAGRAQGVAASVPFLEAKVAGASAAVTLAEARGRLSADASIAEATVTDAAKEVRFNPLRLTGRATLADETWTGDLAFQVPGGPQVASAHLTHDDRTGQGGVAIETGTLAFAPGGLQPAQLSPLAEKIGSPAEGQARFTGRFDWTKTTATGGGTLEIPRLDFKSPGGDVKGLTGRIVFDSLAPLVAAPGQTLRADSISTFAELTGAVATFSLAADALKLSGGEAAMGGGRVRVERLDLPLDPDKTTRGVLLFDGVQLHDLVEASPFGDNVDLDAKVSGRLPFEKQGDHVRILGGALKADQPGRLSILRAALSGVKAQGEVATPAEGGPPTTDTISDFAYQAMEHLAFDTLTADIQTRPDGRLGVLFHIVGRHDPPKHQEIRLTWLQLIRRDFLNRPLPLPSGTGVNLTLDTTLNLDELLADYADYQRLRSSRQVQP